MTRYKNLAGDSGVIAYAIGNNSIKVQFRDGWVYTYTSQRTGRNNIEQMKTLADAGRGLSSFISRVVKNRYASKSKMKRPKAG